MDELCKGYHQEHHQPDLTFGEQACWCSQFQVNSKQQQEERVGGKYTSKFTLHWVKYQYMCYLVYTCHRE